jgi:probable HAF family extracellular repeat protein
MQTSAKPNKQGSASVRRLLLVSSAILSSILLAGAALADSFQGLGLASGTSLSIPQAMSDNGLVVAGNTAYPVRASRWTADNGWERLAVLPSSSGVTEALGISQDGSTLVGYDGFGGCGNARAVRWRGSVVEELVASPGDAYRADSANSDGNVVIGNQGNCGSNLQPARWTSDTGWVLLGNVPGYDRGQAAKSNGDGSAIVGYVYSSFSSIRQAFRWTIGGGIEGLGFLPGGNNSTASGITPDGSIIVGQSNDSSGQTYAVLWNDVAGIVNLGQLPGGSSSFTIDVSDDGSVIVGAATDGTGLLQATRWTAADGMQTVQALLATAGIDTTGWRLTIARGVSADGTIITGEGINPNGVTMGWIANLSLPYQYTFIGFNSPVDNLPISNAAKAGSTIPVKWQLTDTEGNYVSDLASVEALQYVPVACDSQDYNLADAIEAYASGGSGLQYDPLSHEFTYPWKTQKSQKNTCAVFVVTLADNQQHFARFSLR